MTRRDMAVSATLALTLVFGIVGGNFVLHRWVLGNATSREANAGTAATNSAPDDLDDFAPKPRLMTAAIGSAEHREQLRKLIGQKLLNSSEAEQQAWLEELSDVSLSAAESILDLRGEVRTQLRLEESSGAPTSQLSPPGFEFSPVRSR